MPLSTFPRASTLTVAPRFLLTTAWVSWLTALWRYVSVGTFQRTAHNAAVTATALDVLDGAAALVRVSWVLRIVQAATSSSAATVTIGWTDGGQAMTSSGAAVTGNTVSTGQSGEMLVRRDANTDVTVAVSYASSGATPMLYDLDVITEAR